EALRIDLVDGLGTRRAGREPAAARDHLEAADRGIVARRAAELGDNRLAGERRILDGCRRQFFQVSLLLRCRRRVDARVVRCAEFGRQLTVMLAGVFAGAGGDFGGEEVHDRAVLVGRPHAAVSAQETRPGALLAAKTAGAVEESWHEPFEPD